MKENIDLFAVERKRTIFRKVLLGLVIAAAIIVAWKFAYTKILNPPPEDFIGVLGKAISEEGQWNTNLILERDHCLGFTPTYDKSHVLKVTEYVSPSRYCDGVFVKSEKLPSKYPVNLMTGGCICGSGEVKIRSKFLDDIKVIDLWIGKQ